MPPEPRAGRTGERARRALSAACEDPGMHDARALRGIGLWSPQLRNGDPGEVREAAAELDELGYTALWIPGSAGGPVLERARLLLEATVHPVVATGILNLWMHDPADVAEAHASLGLLGQGRFLLGIGVSHPQLVDRDDPGRYRRPLSAMRDYLAALEAQPAPVPRDERVLAALGPKMLDLAREQSAGAHPYFVPPEHTRVARERLGDGPLLAPEQAVVLDTDRARARETAREHVSRYLTLPNYTNNLLRLGFEEADLRDGGSDRLVDAVVVCGDEAAIGRRVQEHRDAGADHVCLQVLGGDALPREQWRALAAALRPAD
jgi:probable F420-dependent oxidoreductase